MWGLRCMLVPASRAHSFAQNFIHYHTYEIDVQFIHPVQAFASQGVVGTLLIDFNLVSCAHCRSGTEPTLPHACILSAAAPGELELHRL